MTPYEKANEFLRDSLFLEKDNNFNLKELSFNNRKSFTTNYKKLLRNMNTDVGYHFELTK